MWDERRWTLLVRSLALASSGAAMALFLGLFAAFFLWRLKKAGWFRAVLFFALPLSPLTYSLLFSFKIPPHIAAALTYALQLMPLNALAIYNGFLAVSAAEIGAARILRSDFVCLLQIVIRRNVPLMLMIGLLSTVLNLLDYSVPSLFGVSVYSLDIFAAFSATGDGWGAAVQALPIFLTSVLVLLVVFTQLGSVWSVNPQGNKGMPSGPPSFFTALEVIGGFVCLLPLIAIINTIMPLFTSRDIYLAAIAASYRELGYSLMICAAAAVIGTAFAAGMGQWKGILLPFALIFAAMPPALVGIGLLYALSPFSFFDRLLPVFALVLRFFPFAAIILHISRRLESKEEREAALLFARTRRDFFIHYQIPARLPALVISAIIIFVLSLGELGATLLVVPPGRATLTIKLYNYLHYGSGASVSGLSFMLGGVTAFIAAAAWGVGKLSFFKRENGTE